MKWGSTLFPRGTLIPLPLNEKAANFALTVKAPREHFGSVLGALRECPGSAPRAIRQGAFWECALGKRYYEEVFWEHASRPEAERGVLPCNIGWNVEELTRRP